MMDRILVPVQKRLLVCMVVGEDAVQFNAYISLCFTRCMFYCLADAVGYLYFCRVSRMNTLRVFCWCLPEKLRLFLLLLPPPQTGVYKGLDKSFRTYVFNTVKCYQYTALLRSACMWCLA